MALPFLENAQDKKSIESKKLKSTELKMKYGIWNNKGGVGKTFLSFILGAEYAHTHPEKNVILVDMCPQANLSEIVLGGNGKGNKNLEKILAKGRKRLTITQVVTYKNN